MLEAVCLASGKLQENLPANSRFAMCCQRQPRLFIPLSAPACLLQIRGDAKAAKARIAESEKRIDSELEAFISKAYW